MPGNLPDDVTPQDIEDHFGGEPDEKMAAGVIMFDAVGRGWDDDQIKESAKEQVREAFNDEINTTNIYDIEIEHLEVV